MNVKKINFLNMDLFEIILKMTLFLLLFHGGISWHVKIPIKFIVLLTFFIEDLWKKPIVWFSLFLFQISGIWFDYYIIDNHQYLLAYWSLAIFLSTVGPKEFHRLSIIKVNGNLLCSFSMIFAVVWKGFLSDDFLKGDFFLFTLFDDSRFHNFTHFLTGLSFEQLKENQWFFNTVLEGDYKNVPIKELLLNKNVKFTILAKTLTYWTLFVEGSIGLLFLINHFWKKRALFILKHIFLLVFILSTYPVATVTGFGWLLAVFGLSDLEDEPLLKVSYFLIILILQIFSIPMGDIFLSLKEF